jgi:hypothetical protein
MQRDLGVRLTPRPWPQDEMPLPDAPPPMPAEPAYVRPPMGRSYQQRAPRPSTPTIPNGASYAPRQDGGARAPHPSRGWRGGGRRQESAS